ncbi:hypothetical protein CORAM0001_0850 [Corynebacterium amycolatum SK46]|nr:hypothetical protein CORAM0001_0850 [Corynebacterium amycolatum SK46]
MAGVFHAVKDEVYRCSLQAGDFADFAPGANALRNCILDGFCRPTSNRRILPGSKESHGDSSFPYRDSCWT